MIGFLGVWICTQVRCKNTRVCRNAGVKVTLTDLNKSNGAGLVLNERAFMAMAKNGKAQELMRRGIVDVEYKRYELSTRLGTKFNPVNFFLFDFF